MEGIINRYINSSFLYFTLLQQTDYRWQHSPHADWQLAAERGTYVAAASLQAG